MIGRVQNIYDDCENEVYMTMNDLEIDGFFT